jgi:hypothetical protein
MFETEIPARRELTGPSWQYIATAGAYLGMGALALVLFVYQPSFERGFWAFSQIFVGVVWFVRYREFNSKPPELAVLGIHEQESHS